MKRIILTLTIVMGICFSMKGADLSTLKWGQVCSGAMDAEWYGSAEALAIADMVVDVQKTNGGWMKNYELHKLTAGELNALKASRGDHSCLDNNSTTQEMRFLAKVWQKSKVEKYRLSFVKALEMIFTAEKSCGGWSQYWPLAGNGSYWDYITFNDNLMTNVLKLMNDICNNKGDFADITDETTRQRCRQAFDRGIDVILKCQVDDNGTKSAWCAQHDPADLLPAVGRPHELPSISGFESASLLSFLMSLPDPSPELQECIIAGVTWFDKHKIEGKALESYTNAKGEQDQRIIDKPGSAIWGRFIQFGGEKGKEVYEKFFNMLKNRGKKRSYTYQGKTYTYTEEEIARTSYREDKAYQPIYAIYENAYPHLYYRFLYNYEDTEPVVDSKGLPVATSLMSQNRRNYQYLGSWCRKLIEVEYPAWKEKVDTRNEAGDALVNELSAETYTSSSADKQTYNFSNGFSISNKKGKAYGAGKTNTLKYSSGVEYTINIPDGLKVTKISFYGYDNYDVDACLSKLNGSSYGATDYVFPGKVNDEPKYVKHVIDFGENPVSGSLPFTLGTKQCCLTITLFCTDTTSGIESVKVISSAGPVKRIKGDGVVIIKDGKTYGCAGQRME
ncbi:pectate lyase [Xylanibacter caecicola]|uniref:pectate lyase n=1 Tax=Xylanibacter caecicola TaxID=2736294 RepID=UPI0025848FCE|nr:pectate lyase [Xylanibacter caecicola]